MKKYSTIILIITVLCIFNLSSQVLNKPQSIPKEYRLNQNIPDPFDTSGTKIYFELPYAIFVSLWIEDIQGNLIASLMSRQCTAGYYYADWDAKRQDSTYIIPGTYLCKMKVDSLNTTIFKDSIQMHFQMVTGVRENVPCAQPSYFRLNQNYPNPFNPTTTILFHLQSRSFVSLKIFDLLGREIATIVSEELLAGSYSKQWNAMNVPSGIYFYCLQAGTSIDTKKLVLLK
jgi:hypothetical protein